jgi:hypothetical protein
MLLFDMMGSSSSTFVSGLVVGSAVTAIVFYISTYDGRKRRFNDEEEGDEEPSLLNSEASRLVKSRSMAAGFSSSFSPAKTFLRGLNRSLLHNTSAAYGATDTDTASFFTRIIGELWDHLRIAAADQVQSSIEPYFVGMPPPINTCRFTKVDLGNVPFKMNRMVVHPKTSSNDFVQWDFDVEWDSECKYDRNEMEECTRSRALHYLFVNL